MKLRNYPIPTALLAVLTGALHLYGQGTDFTYQGRLNAGGQGLSPSGFTSPLRRWEQIL